MAFTLKSLFLLTICSSWYKVAAETHEVCRPKQGSFSCAKKVLVQPFQRANRGKREFLTFWLIYGHGKNTVL